MGTFYSNIRITEELLIYCTWEDDIRNVMKKMKIKNWTSRIQDRNKWKLYVEKGKI